MQKARARLLVRTALASLAALVLASSAACGSTGPATSAVASSSSGGPGSGATTSASSGSSSHGGGSSASSSASAGGCGAGGATSSASTSASVSASSSSSSSSSSSASTSSSASSSSSSSSGAAAVPVLTQHNDNARTGANLSEATLTTANVSMSTFGALFTRAVDDEVYAQILYMPGVTITGQGIHDVFFVATMNDTVYAFDADDPTLGAPLWQRSFLDPANGIVPLSHNDVGQNCGTYMDIDGNIGIVTTPVIDGATGTLYVLARTKNMSTGVASQELHALDVSTGVDRAASPVTIAAQVPGTGDGGSTITFDPLIQNPRPALTLANGKVYLAWASHCDTGPYHGWVMAYDATTLSQSAAFVVTPNGALGGLWMSGQGATVDAAGDLYVVTGNGDFDADKSGSDYGESILRLGPDLTVKDYFTPFDFANLNASDLDLGTAGALLVPGTTLLAFGGKAGKLYVTDATKLGHFNAAGDTQIVQSFALGGGEIHGAPVAWSQAAGPLVYVWASTDVLRSYRLMGGQLMPVAMGPAAPSGGQPGGVLSLSANGEAQGSGVLWATLNFLGDANNMTVPGILIALDATSLAELWNSKQSAGDDFGSLAKFVPPTVTGGKVFLPTFSHLVYVYGLK